MDKDENLEYDLLERDLKEYYAAYEVMRRNYKENEVHAKVTEYNPNLNLQALLNRSDDLFNKDLQDFCALLLGSDIPEHMAFILMEYNHNTHNYIFDYLKFKPMSDAWIIKYTDLFAKYYINYHSLALLSEAHDKACFLYAYLKLNYRHIDNMVLAPLVELLISSFIKSTGKNADAAKALELGFRIINELPQNQDIYLNSIFSAVIIYVNKNKDFWHEAQNVFRNQNINLFGKTRQAEMPIVTLIAQARKGDDFKFLNEKLLNVVEKFTPISQPPVELSNINIAIQHAMTTGVWIIIQFLHKLALNNGAVTGVMDPSILNFIQLANIKENEIKVASLLEYIDSCAPENLDSELVKKVVLIYCNQDSYDSAYKYSFVKILAKYPQICVEFDNNLKENHNYTEILTRCFWNLYNNQSSMDANLSIAAEKFNLKFFYFILRYNPERQSNNFWNHLKTILLMAQKQSVDISEITYQLEHYNSYGRAECFPFNYPERKILRALYLNKYIDQCMPLIFRAKNAPEVPISYNRADNQELPIAIPVAAEQSHSTLKIASAPG